MASVFFRGIPNITLVPLYEETLGTWRPELNAFDGIFGHLGHDIDTIMSTWSENVAQGRRHYFVPAITPERYKHMSYATGLRPDNFVAIYKQKRSSLSFDALTANISWQFYFLLLLSFVFFVAIHQTIEQTLQHKQRVKHLK